MANPYDHEPPVSTGIYFKFVDGHEHKIRIASDPVIYTSSYQGQNPREMYAWIIFDTEQKVAQVLQLPPSVYRQIKGYAKDEDYGDPKQYGFKITRTGQKFDTKYELKPSPKKIPLDEAFPEAAEMVAKIDLIASVEKGQGNSDVEWLDGSKEYTPVCSEEDAQLEEPFPTNPREDDSEEGW